LIGMIDMIVHRRVLRESLIREIGLKKWYRP